MSSSYNRSPLSESGIPVPPFLDVDGHGDTGHRDDVGRFLERIYEAVARGDLDGATDELYDRVDGLLDQGDLAACDRILRTVDPGRLDSHLMVAFLVITLPARAQLREREAFRDAVERILTDGRGKETAEEILRGLE